MRARYAAYAVGIAVAWVLLWDRISLANFLGGLVVAAITLTAFPLHRTAPSERRIVHLPALIRLAAHVLFDIAASNVLVARQIVGRGHPINTGIVACRMRVASPKVHSTVANAIVLSPGTMAVEAIAEPPTLFIHVLTLDDITAVRRRVSDLEMMVIKALGSAGDRAALARGSTAGGRT